MEKELFQRIAQMDIGDLETQIVLQCAPLIAGIKMSNLFIVSNENAPKVGDLFCETKISTYTIYESKDRCMFLLYKEGELEAYLKAPSTKKIFEILGYHAFLLSDILNEVTVRYSRYRRDKKAFPHEIGILLGYPVEDVLGFMENEGKNFLYTGYWKVYSNVEDKIALFDKYNQEKEKLVHLLFNEGSIMQILNQEYQK